MGRYHPLVCMYVCECICMHGYIVVTWAKVPTDNSTDLRAMNHWESKWHKWLTCNLEGVKAKGPFFRQRSEKRIYIFLENVYLLRTEGFQWGKITAHYVTECVWVLSKCVRNYEFGAYTHFCNVYDPGNKSLGGSSFKRDIKELWVEKLEFLRFF